MKIELNFQKIVINFKLILTNFSDESYLKFNISFALFPKTTKSSPRNPTH
jgi:hypothetical protein